MRPLESVFYGHWISAALSLIVCLTVVQSAEKECHFGLNVLWSAKLRDSPLTATPLLFDVDGDGYDDIVVASFSGEVWSIHGESGHIVDNWPFYLEDRSFHASPLVCDLNADGVLEFLLTTTDGEIVFIQSDNTLLHGETIKLPPLRVERYWYKESDEYIQKLANQMTEQFGQEFSVNPPTKKKAVKSSHTAARNTSKPFSEFETKFGRFADSLYSTNQPEPRPSGVDPSDSEYVFVDPHVLATPTLADLNGDGVRNELVLPVSYYFDPIEYGSSTIGRQILNGLDKDELMNFVAAGIVVIDLELKTVVNRKVFKLTRANSDQPGYSLATPTIVQLPQGVVIIVGTATGELHMLSARDLTSVTGFPVLLDSIASQVAVGDVAGTGSLSIVVGDYSGNVVCIDQNGRREWEQETDEPVISSIRFADLEGDGNIEVVVTTHSGDLWILNGRDGTPHSPNYPLHLQTPVQSAPLLLHLNNSARQGDALAVVMATSEGIYIFDALTACMDSFPSEHVFMEVLADDIDPYSPGLELLAVSLDGYLVCFSTASRKIDPLYTALESWSGDAIGQNGFTHKSSSFALVLPHANHTVRDISGTKFNLDFQIYQYAKTSQEYTIRVDVGRKFNLHSSVITVSQQLTDVSLSVATPPSPLKAFVTVQICNRHHQCDVQSYIVKFNLHFEDNLKWLLALPFLFLCVFVLWAYRDVGVASLPTVTASTSRKQL